MGADIIDFPLPKACEGNGSREVVKLFFETVQNDRAKAQPSFVSATENGDLSDTDYFLAWLYNEGFKIVPVE